MMPLFGPPQPSSAEDAAKIEAFRKACQAHDIAWRRTVTGPWAFLYCSCRETGAERCRVHGQFLVTPDGEIL